MQDLEATAKEGNERLEALAEVETWQEERANMERALAWAPVRILRADLEKNANLIEVLGPRELEQARPMCCMPALGASIVAQKRALAADDACMSLCKAHHRTRCYPFKVHDVCACRPQHTQQTLRRRCALQQEARKLSLGKVKPLSGGTQVEASIAELGGQLEGAKERGQALVHPWFVQALLCCRRDCR